MTYLKKMAEQIIRIIERGDPTGDKRPDRREIYLLIQQALNKRLKLEMFQVNIPDGEMLPPHAAIATYDVPITSGDPLAGVESCTVFDVSGFSSNWIAPTLEDWINNAGEPWAIQIFTVGFTATGTGPFSISVTGINLTAGRTAQELEDFITNANADDYIHLRSFPDTMPHSFIRAGMSNIVVTDQGATVDLTFDYDITLTTSAPQLIQDKAAGTHALLTGGGFGSSAPLSNIEVCVFVSNAGTDYGRAILPAQPLNLPRAMGIWQVYDPLTPYDPYVPVPPGDYALLKNVSHTKAGNIIEDIAAYEVYDRYTIQFNRTVAQLPASVTMKLLVVDPAQLLETDILPIPPEMEIDVIRDVLELMGVEIGEDLAVDNNPKR